MSKVTKQAKALGSKPIPVKFSEKQHKRLSEASFKSGVTQADIIRIGAWMVSQMTDEQIIEAKLKFVRSV